MIPQSRLAQNAKICGQPTHPSLYPALAGAGIVLNGRWPVGHPLGTERFLIDDLCLFSVFAVVFYFRVSEAQRAHLSLLSHRQHAKQFNEKLLSPVSQKEMSHPHQKTILNPPLVVG